MTRHESQSGEGGGPEARWWRPLGEGRVECLLCPHGCTLAEGHAGLCGTRLNRGGAMRLASVERCSGLAVDPIEKKPLYHFLPGTTALSFGTTGCNLGCLFCQNWQISQVRLAGQPTQEASPASIVRLALREQCASVAFTYNDPVVFAEQALDTARACHAHGLRTVAVTAGYIVSGAREEFFAGMDAANIDLKSFSDDFYRRLCRATLQPVLDTLVHVRRATAVWLEVTTLLIPGENDSDDELCRAADWYAENLGPDVPWHFTAFHPDHRMRDHPRTPVATLRRARGIALERGLRYVYTGNVDDPEGALTRCPACRAVLIRREGFSVVENWIRRDGLCPRCGAPLAGRFA